MNRSYTPTEQLTKVREADPALAEAIEKLCRATMALRGPAMMLEANSSLTYAATALAPFVVMQEAFDEVQRSKGNARLPPEIRPEEADEYRRIMRSTRSHIAIQRVVAKRGA